MTVIETDGDILLESFSAVILSISNLNAFFTSKGHISVSLFDIKFQNLTIYFYLRQNVPEELTTIELVKSDGLLHSFTDRFCSLPAGIPICKLGYFSLYGVSIGETDDALIPEFTLQYPAGISSKQLIHYMQEVNSSKFIFFIHHNSSCQ